jgi:hypothetical protein
LVAAGTAKRAAFTMEGCATGAGDIISRMRFAYPGYVVMACCMGPGQGTLLRPIHVRVREIDHFKQINDTCGHEAGDQVLRHFTDVLRDCCRKSDVLVRWGGEAFFG